MIQGMQLLSFSSSPAGDLVIATYDVQIYSTAVTLDFDNFEPVALVSCVIPSRENYEAGARACFDIDTKVLSQTIPSGVLRPHVQITMMGTFNNP